MKQSLFALCLGMSLSVFAETNYQMWQFYAIVIPTFVFINIFNNNNGQ